MEGKSNLRNSFKNFPRPVTKNTLISTAQCLAETISFSLHQQKLKQNESLGSRDHIFLADECQREASKLLYRGSYRLSRGMLGDNYMKIKITTNDFFGIHSFFDLLYSCHEHRLFNKY